MEKDFWLIDSNSVAVTRFYRKDKNQDTSFEYMFIEEGIVMGIHGENPPLMKTRKIMRIEDARCIWKNLIDQGWQRTKPKW